MYRHYGIHSLKKKFYWSIVDLHCCVDFCYSEKWLSYTYILFHYGLSWDIEYSSLCYTVAAAAKPLQSCPTLCDPIDSSPPGSPIPGILQTRTLEWVAISFCNAWKWNVKVKSLSCVQPSVTPWTVAFQAPPSMGFSRQEYWSGVPLPSPPWPLQAPNFQIFSYCGFKRPPGYWGPRRIQQDPWQQ